jgi:DNA mismatch repair protein MutS
MKEMSAGSHPPEPATPVRFRSILFDESEAGADPDAREAPEFFPDLNLDQVVAKITAGRDEYNLEPFFYTPLRQVEAINYRYEVFRDLEHETLRRQIRQFAEAMRAMRAHISQGDKLYYPHQKESSFLDAVDLYCSAVTRLTDQLADAHLRSRGLRAFREYLTSYTASHDFVSLVAETQKLKASLSDIRYSLRIEGNRVEVARYDSEPDYGAEVLQTFEKFKQGAPKEYRFRFASLLEMNHVEAAILDLVAELYPEVFVALGAFCSGRRGYLDKTVATFDREVQFYIALVDHLAPLKQAGLPFCYPTVTDRSKEVCGRDVFDLALAVVLTSEHMPVVTNDFDLRNPERILVVTGPNQGGKTTFARTFGQLHYLASIGCPVPGKSARLFLFDRLFTHFEREEDIENLSGKLEDDLLRIHHILGHATPASILIMNESFLSTTLSDALFLSKRILQRIIALDMLCVSVTFLDELASLSETTVSMVSTVELEDPALRTFKIVRKPAEGLAYAMAIAEKHRLTYEHVRGRLRP